MRRYFKEFDSIIFMGNGGCGCTASNIFKLHKLVDKCIGEVGGLQQPPHSESEEAAKRAEQEYKEGWEDVREMVRDIAMALTGEKITFPDETIADKEVTWEELLDCGDRKPDGTEYWCKTCDECKRFDAEYEAFLEYHEGHLTREQYIRQTKLIEEKFGK